jgi:leader peptidase (prepilin peptidase)/N-methyltransferase
MSIPLLVVGLAIAPFLGPLRGVEWRGALAGALIGGGGLFVVQFAYARLTRREGLGTGDVLLLGGIGAWLGAIALPFVLLAGSVLGLTYAVGLHVATRGAAVAEGKASRLGLLPVPFGPFLVIASFVWLLFGERIQAALQASPFGLGGL